MEDTAENPIMCSSATPSNPYTTKPKKGKSIMYDGYAFTHHYKTDKHNAYRCKHFSRFTCKAKVSITLNKSQITATDVHSIPCKYHNGNKTTIDLDILTTHSEFSAYMADRVKKMFLDDPSKMPLEVWDEINLEMTLKYKCWAGMMKEQVVNLVNNTRQATFGGDIYAQLEAANMTTMKDGTGQQFLQSNCFIANNVKKIHSRILCFANPKLLRLLSGPKHLYIDGTFKCVPSQFSQLLIVMIFNDSTSSYVPVMYILLQGKSEFEYKHALQQLINCSENKCKAITVTCDFEKALHNCARKQFGKAKIVGCLFHFKQALRRRMKTVLHIKEDQIQMAMEKNSIDILTIINNSEIRGKGLMYVKSIVYEYLTEEKDITKWDNFFRYFEFFWLSDDKFINTWNVHEDDHDGFDIINRSNNPLESYNKHMKSVFDNKRPSMNKFIVSTEK